MEKRISSKQVLAVIGTVIAILLGYLIYVYMNDRINERTFFVIFSTDGGTRITGQSVKINELIEKPEDPKKEGYKFLYWSYLNEEYNFNKPVTSNMNLFAVWEKEEIKKEE